MINLILFGTFFIMLLLNIPIAVSLGTSAILAMVYAHDPFTVISTNVYNGMAKFLLLAIPFFVLSGNIMAKAGISTRLVNFIDDCVGHRRGGIAIVCVIVACFFGAISGSGPATVAALGIILIPAMINRGGFSAPFASAMMATASSIAIVIPPSIAFVVYASITGVSVGDMFMGGILPGIMMGLALVIIIMLEVRKQGLKASRERASWGQRARTFGTAFWGFLVPVIILGGIYGGIFTPTESAVVAVVYTLIIGFVVYKELTWKKVWDAFMETGALNGTTTFMVGLSMSFAAYLTLAGIPSAVGQAILSLDAGPVVILLLINVVLLVVGCFVDNISSTIILTPILLPIAQGVGMTAVQFGIVMTVNLAIGFITPPYGVNLFYGSAIGKVSIEELSKKILPFIGAMIICLLLLTFIEPLSMWLPTLMAAKAD